MSLLRCFTQIVLWLFSCNILRRVEAGEVLSYDFVRCVLLDFLGARVPSHHIAHRVKHVDGVLFNAIDEDMKLLLGLPHSRLGRLIAVHLMVSPGQLSI